MVPDLPNTTSVGRFNSNYEGIQMEVVGILITGWEGYLWTHGLLSGPGGSIHTICVRIYPRLHSCGYYISQCVQVLSAHWILAALRAGFIW